MSGGGGNSVWYVEKSDGEDKIPTTGSSASGSPIRSSPVVDKALRLRTVSGTSDSSLSKSPRMVRANRPPNLLETKMSNHSGEAINVPPVVLSPVLSRPVRSSSAASSPLPLRHSHGSDSDASDGWRGSGGKTRRSLASAAVTAAAAMASRPNTPTLSPILNRSGSGNRLSNAFNSIGVKSGCGSGAFLSGRVAVHRTNSNTESDRHKKRIRRKTMMFGHGMCSESSMESNWSSSSSNLTRLRSCLGHSDPQISASSSHAPTARSTKDVQMLSQASRSSAARRSLNASTSPVLAPRCRSPVRLAAQPSSSRTTAPASYSTRSGSSLMAPQPDNRRWSLASLPSTSGYGTPGSNSAFSSQYSSSEHLSEMLDYMRLSHNSGRYDSNDSNPASEDPNGAHFRPRSRSLTSPVKFGNQFRVDCVNRNSVYKERFPKAKTQMEDRLAAFVAENAPLSGEASTNVEVHDVRSNRRSMVLEAETCADQALLRLIGDGATRFLHHQIVEIASDCLTKSREDSISCSYFVEMSQRLDETLNEAQCKTSPESLTYLTKLVKQLLMIVSRPARLLECLEFDPDEFYHLLEEAEGVVREQLGSGNARVPDLPQYIIGKLGLDRDPLMDVENRSNSPPTPVSTAPSASTGDVLRSRMEDCMPGTSRQQWSEQRPPREEDFDTIRLVSNGAYGAVFLVRHRETRQRFALKKMNKQTLMLRNQVDQVFAERDILTMTDNPFVVSFYGSFETRNHLCMLMEYVEGGDCAALLKSAGTLPIDLARLYIAETILAIEYLHSYGIVHRDLKPDNLLITAMGHIKLTDFGLSKIGLMNRTTLVAEVFDISDTQQFKDKQLCGTPEYIAPEVILRQGYGKPVDWWALGVILYEFLVGIVPFFGETPEELFSKVIAEDVEYPDGEEALPPEAEDLIRRLLEKNPVERLGALLGAPQLISHPFFEGLDFTSLLRQKAEFVPQLDNEEDTSYFDTRSDRYNHEAEGSCGEEDANAPMFHSFSTASPRHSIVAIDPSMLPSIAALAQIPAAPPTPSPMVVNERVRKPSSTTQSSEDHSIDMGDPEKFDSMDSVPGSGQQPIPSAVLLRRRFSAQRQANLSTSSSGTTGTGCLNTACSSTDSSMDASHVCSVPIGDARRSPLPRFAISCDPEDHQHHSSMDSPRGGKELSPVNETVRFRGAPSPLQLVIPSNSTSQASTVTPSTSDTTCYVVSTGQLSPGGGSMSSTSSIDGSSPLHPDQLSPAAVSKPPITIRKGPLGFGFTIKSVRVYLGENSEYYNIEHIVTAVVEGSPAFESGLRSEDLITHVNGEPVHNLTHPQLMRCLLGYGSELTLKVTPLAATSIKEGAPRKSVGKLAKKKPKRPQRRTPLDKKPRKPSGIFRRLSGKRSTNDIVPGSSSQKQTFMPRSVSSQDGTMVAGPSGTAPIAYPHHHAGHAPALASTSSTSSSSAVPQPGHPHHHHFHRHHHENPMTTLAHKRMSDVGLREENRSPLVTSRPSSLRGLKPTPPLPALLKPTLSSPSASSSGGPSIKVATSPIPVSPLARVDLPEPIVVRPTGDAPSAFAPPASVVQRSDSPRTLTSSGRNLMNRLLHKDTSK